MNTDTLVFIAQTLVLPATLIVSLVVSVIVAVTAHKTARRLTSLEMLRGVDQQWQALNAAILTRPEIQRHIGAPGDDISERGIVRRNIAFYVLNVALQLRRGQVAGLIGSSVRRGIDERLREGAGVDRCHRRACRAFALELGASERRHDVGVGDVVQAQQRALGGVVVRRVPGA